MIVVVTGTGTDVGKTWVTAAVARTLRDRGAEVHARKPVQSFAPDDPTTDADVLADATGEPVERVCPPHRRLETPRAPPMAAAALGRRGFTIAELAAEVEPPATGLTFVEGAGGLLSPLADDGDTRALIERLAPARVVLVADAGLGTINAVRLSAEALGPSHSPLVFLNRFDERNDLHVRNASWLRDRDGLIALTQVRDLADQLLAQ